LKYNLSNSGEWIGIILDDVQGKNGENQKKKLHIHIIFSLYFKMGHTKVLAILKRNQIVVYSVGRLK
jgi:hypothetical protein